ncbi:MAG TPA: hypothetical protein VM050_07775 [Patescibacteria group bacterium]|nr:hypothetical protein [Patescibacteria group bacterium]
MGLKSVALVIVGLLIGGAVGYGVSLVYTPEFLVDLLPENYVSRFEELGSMFEGLTSEHEGTLAEIAELVGNLENLTSMYEGLNLDMEDLDEAFSGLSEDNSVLAEELAALTEEHEALLRAYNESLDSYDTLMMQYLIVTGISPLMPETQSNDTIRKDFAWNYGGKTWATSLFIPQQLYDYYSNKTRVPTEDYSVYVTHPIDDEYLFIIANIFESISLGEGYTEIEQAELVISFVQSLPYSFDNVSTGFDDYPRYPIETLVVGGGDCEDSSILTSALMDTMGYDLVLFNLPDHVAVGLAVDTSGIYWEYEGTNYFYVETTGEGWQIGQIPEDYEGVSATISPLLPHAVCTLDWSASRVRQKMTIVAEVINVGTAEASNLKLYVAFEGGSGQIWNPKESTFFNLAVEEEKDISLELTVPYDVYTRMLVWIIDTDDKVLEERNSEWFDTN